MADSYSSPGTPNTPLNIPTPLRSLEIDHAPSIPSPLNPDAKSRALPKPIAREQREKKDSLKKRESAAAAVASVTQRGVTPDVKPTFKAVQSAGPRREKLLAPEGSAYLAPKELAFASREPEPFVAPDGYTELKKPVDGAYNRPGYRAYPCVADPLFKHKQYYRQSEIAPYAPHMSVPDSDKNLYFDTSCMTISNEKGWRMSRANVYAREGSMYYEVKVVKGIPQGTPIGLHETTPQPHVRVGWARREAPLDAPVGYDGYSYGITDSRFDTLHRSRVGKFLTPKGRPKKNQPTTQEIPPEPLREGDVIGLLINLPPLSIHRKVVEGDYNPAVDFFSAPDPDATPPDIIRDRTPIISRTNYYLEHFEYQASKAIKQYSERTPVNVIRPNPNHQEIPLRSLPQSSIKIYRNGTFAGTAFDNLLAFLPPASIPSPEGGARQGFDDGSLGYYPVISVFNGGIATVNFGPDFWYPPPELNFQEDVQMLDTDGAQVPSAEETFHKPRPISERYREQIAEDVVWDIIDEAAFYVVDGGD